MGSVYLTKRIEFSASHRYHNDAWDAERNRQVFGACNHAEGHGHNYLLEVTVGGDLNHKTGMVVNLYDLKQVLKEVLADFDHKHLNYDTPYFKDRIPTTENIAAVLWRLLSTRDRIGQLEKLRLYEDEDLSAEISRAGWDDGRLRAASLVRRYHFSAGHDVAADGGSHEDNRRRYGNCSRPGGHGHNYVVEVTVTGAVNPETGMVTDLPALDRAVRERILVRLQGTHLNRDPGLPQPTGENLARWVWQTLISAVPVATLQRVRVVETPESAYEYAGE